jgi:hypothetical protein
VKYAAAAARAKRLDYLARGLAREITLILEADEPMLYAERQAYLKALYAALDGIVSARAALVKARQRIDNGGG